MGGRHYNENGRTQYRLAKREVALTESTEIFRGKWLHWFLDKVTVTDEQSYATTWYDGDFRAISHGVDLQGLKRAMMINGEVLMEDGSPVLFRDIEVIEDNQANTVHPYMRVTGRFGVDEIPGKSYAGDVLRNVYGF